LAAQPIFSPLAGLLKLISTRICKTLGELPKPAAADFDNLLTVSGRLLIDAVAIRQAISFSLNPENPIRCINRDDALFWLKSWFKDVDD
jgi:hypothetical protein